MRASFVVKRRPRFACSLFAALLAPGLVLNAAATGNQTLKLDGQGSYVALPNDRFTNLTEVTVEAWARWDSFPNYARVLEFGRSWNSLALFNEGASNHLRFNLYPRPARADARAQHTIRATGVLRTNEWLHLAALAGPGGMKLYLNGRLVGEHTNTASLADIAAPQTNLLGRGMSGNATDRDFRGELDEIRVWNHRRTPEQIREQMFKRLSGREAGLVALWGFDDGTARDGTGRGADGVLHGRARIAPGDLGLVAETPVVAAAPITVVAPPVAPVPERAGFSPAWWIAGALTVLALVLGWLAFLFRRSGLGEARLVGVAPARGALPAAGGGGEGEVKERALAELTDFAKQSLVQGLYSQREALMQAHQQARQELAELEARIVSLRLPDRIQAYEQRIAELEGELASRSDELREVTRATLDVLRQKLAAEKQSAPPGGSRLN